MSKTVSITSCIKWAACAFIALSVSACDKTPERGALLMPEIYAPAMGSVAIHPKGHIILVNFFDFRSPNVREIFPKLLTMVYQHPDVRFIYRVVPILGEQSVKIAQLSIAAQFQEKQVSYRDALLLSNKPLDFQVAINIAAATGMDVKQLEADVSSTQVKDQINENLSLAHRLGIQTLPAYVIAYADDEDHVVTASLVQGDVSLLQIKQLINEMAKKLHKPTLALYRESKNAFA